MHFLKPARPWPAAGAWALVLGLAVPGYAQAGWAAPVGVKAATSSAAAAANANQDETILVEVRVDRLVLADSLGARPAPAGGLRLPLGELANALGLAISVDAAHGTAQGFVLREDRRFTLDVDKQLVVLAGRQLPFDASQIERQPDDIYVDMKLLTQWFPLGLTYDPFGLILHVAPLEPLPAQERVERERRAEQGGAAPVDPSFPLVQTPYALLGEPAIDPSFSFGLAPDDSGTLRPNFTYGVLADADVLGLNAQGYVAGTLGVMGAAPLSAWHGTIGRKDPDGGLLGPVGARELSAGYVFDPGLPLVAGAWSGNGALASSFPLSQPARFDRQSFRGPLPSGWDAQLFQNGFPAAYQPAGTSGEYRFDDVPLVVGPNEFRIVMIGPQGQRREEVKRFNIGATLAPPGEHRFRVIDGLDPLTGRNRLTAVVEQGFSGSLTGAAGIARLPLAAGPVRQYGLASLRGTLGEVFWHTDGAVADDGGKALEVGAEAATGLFGASLAQDLLAGFSSENFLLSADPVVARSSARVDARTPDGFALPATLALTGQVDRLTSGSWLPQLGNQLSARLPWFTVTNVLTFDPDQGGPFSDGTIGLDAPIGDLDLRGQATYTPAAVSTVAVLSSGQALQDYHWNAGLSYELASGRPLLAVGVNRIFGVASVGLNATVSYPLVVTAGLDLSGGLGWLGGGWLASGQSLASTGTAVVRAFIDANRNGRYDPGERLLPGVTIDVGGLTVATNAQGRAVVPGLAAYVPLDADFSKVVLDDPLLIPALKGTHFVPRPGRATLVELPVVAAGEIYGTVHVSDQGVVHELGGATVELLDAHGAVQATSVAGLDGYFALTELPPGRYRLRVAPAQLVQLGLQAAQPREVVIPGEGAVFDGQDFTLLQTGKPAP